ncbi:MAG: DUF1501 domain-containing protein [Planctomycetota bacterium]
MTPHDSIPSPLLERARLLTRRALLQGSASFAGAAALAKLGLAAPSTQEGAAHVPHFAPRAKRVIYLFMSGAPSQIDLFDWKPGLAERFDQDLPDSVVDGQRFTTMTSGQKRFPVAPTKYAFAQHGRSGAWVSELLPNVASMVDDLAIVKSMYTEAINHDPAITFIQTGHEQPGRPSLGSWLSYGLGSPNEDLPAFVVMLASWTGRKDAQALFSRLWGSGFLPSQHQGVALRSVGDPVLYLSDPAGVDRTQRRRMLDALAELNHREAETSGDPETLARIEQYEMAFRMQRSVPELVDVSGESRATLDLYGPDVTVPGTFAASCLLARRLAERGVPMIQIFHRGWDQHDDVAGMLPKQCRDVDRPSYGLIKDLEQRGLLDDTLVVWGGEFGRTVYCQGPLTRDNYGRDHHPRCFTMWLAGGGIKRGVVHGETDDYSYNIVKDGVHVHDLNATLLNQLGFDHERLTYRFQGRDFRLTDVHGRVVRELLA